MSQATSPIESDPESAKASTEWVSPSNMSKSALIDDTESLKSETQGKRLFRYVIDQRRAKVEPWCQEYGILHRMNITDINNQLAECKKIIYEEQSASKRQMRKLRRILDEQATAIRNFEYIQSLDWLPKMGEDFEYRLSQVKKYFPEVADNEVEAYHTENYRQLVAPAKPYPHGDPLRNFLCSYLPVWLTYSDDEKNRRKGQYTDNRIPRDVSPLVERLARFVIAMFGAVSILVPMIVMSFDNSRTKSLVTTSAAVLLFACCCSFTLRTANDQTLAATAGYAAVLMVFVGLTLTPS